MPRSPRALLLLLLLPALVGGAASQAGADPELVEPAAIDDALAKGVAYLLGKQRANGTWGTGSKELGHTALATFALLHAGLREDQLGRPAKRLRRAFAFLDRHGPGRAGKREEDPGTYTTALLLLLLRERGRPIDRARMQRLTDLLVRTQAANGQWWYYGRPGRTGKTGAATGDNSNTQFAVLALAAATGEGLVVPRATLERAREWWRSSVQSDGGFGYASGGSRASASTGSMTAAGVACLGALNALLDGHPIPRAAPSTPAGPQPTKAPPVLLGLDWLQAHWSVTRNEGPSQGAVKQRQRKAGRGWLHYYLWTLERAFVLAEVERIGTHDWYREGAGHLLATQAKDGSWRGEHPLYATSFALLFLTRAADPPRAFTQPRPAPDAAPPREPVVTGPGAPGASPPDAPLPADGAEEEVGITGSLTDWIEAPLPPGELARRCRARGATTLVPLVAFLQDPDAKIRQRAFEALSELLPAERVFRIDRHPLARGRLRRWLAHNERFLHVVEGRFAPR